METFDSMFLPGAGGGLPTGEGFDFDDFRADVGTISPQEMHNDPLVMSNPPSTAFPNLSTPDSSFLESPALASSGLNTTPLEDGLLDSSLDFESMPSLFPHGGYDQFGSVSDNLHQTTSFTSINSRPSNPTSSAASPMVRQKSSPGRPPAPVPVAVHARKHSDTGGVRKTSTSSKTPRKILADIVIDSEDDKETAKRKKNTAAARKSRLRKQETVESLVGEVNRLRAIITLMGGNPDHDFPGVDS